MQLFGEQLLHVNLMLEFSIHRAEPVRRLDAIGDVEDKDVEAFDDVVHVPARQVANVSGAVPAVPMRPGQLELGGFAC